MRITISHSWQLPPTPGVAHPIQQLLLTPLSGATQTIASWKVEGPGVDQAAMFSDAFGNRVHLVNQHGGGEPLTITAQGTVQTRDHNGVLGFSAADPVPALFRRATADALANPGLVAEFIDWSRRGTDRIGLLHALLMRVHETSAPAPAEPRQMQADGAQVQTMSGMTQSQGSDEAAPAEEQAEPPTPSALAHSFIGTARALDIPSRYVTGYLVPEADMDPEFHAWAEAFDDRLGWIGFDPSLGLCPTTRHVRVAVALDAAGAAPIRTSTPALLPQTLSLSVTGEES